MVIQSPEIGGISFKYASYNDTDLLEDLYGRGILVDARIKLGDYWKLVSILANLLGSEYGPMKIRYDGYRYIPYALADSSKPNEATYLIFLSEPTSDRDEADDILHDFYSKYYKDFQPVLVDSLIFVSRYEWPPDYNPRITRSEKGFHFTVRLKLPGFIQEDFTPILDKYNKYIGPISNSLDKDEKVRAGIRNIPGYWMVGDIDDIELWYYQNDYGHDLNRFIKFMFNNDYDIQGPKGHITPKQWANTIIMVFNYVKENYSNGNPMALMSTREHCYIHDDNKAITDYVFHMSIVVFTDTLEEADNILSSFLSTSDSDVRSVLLEARVIPDTTIPKCGAKGNMVELVLDGLGEWGIVGSEYRQLRKKYKDLIKPINPLQPTRVSRNLNLKSPKLPKNSLSKILILILALALVYRIFS